MERKRIVLKGIVQGVGFRPHVWRKAGQFGLSGFVQNTAAGVVLEVEGRRVDEFIQDMVANPPPRSRISEWNACQIPLRHSRSFRIRNSRNGSGRSLIAADIATCSACWREFSDPANRRHRYPFINCTDCGPRFSIIRSMPYDRPRTTMEIFPMCPECRREYENPLDRRFHAQPVSCPRCGPRLRLADAGAGNLDGPVRHADPLAAAGRVLGNQRILAVKGIGGYHLACLAGSDRALRRLRRMKNRPAKAFALMGTMVMIESHCQVSVAEKELLRSPAAPIVLLRRKPASTLSKLVAPRLNRIGFMLPYAPLHRLLLEMAGQPLVMTSANRAEEPIIAADDLPVLMTMADAILTHDRGIEMFCDDSVTQVSGKSFQIIRRGRGHAPLPLDLPFSSFETVLGLGAMLKTTFTLLYGSQAFMSPHIATTDSASSLAAEKKQIDHFRRTLDLKPSLVAFDRHPLYPNRMLADDFPGSRHIEIQHHRAHAASLLAEKGETGPVIAIVMDGTGYGDDGSIWGGEFFYGDMRRLERRGHLRTFFLPNGDQAIHQPWRTALALLQTANNGSARAERAERARHWTKKFGRQGEMTRQAIELRHQAAGVMTSSCGRLFDGVASLLGLGDSSSYDGELPAVLQSLAEAAPGSDDASYPFDLGSEGDCLTVDFLPALDRLLTDRRSIAKIARAFHLTVARGFAAMAQQLRHQGKQTDVVALSGGVFQNQLLQEMTVDLLERAGFRVLTHCQVPANDGGISLGQACLAALAPGGE